MVPINRKKLLAIHAALVARKVEYGYGAKAEGGSDPRNNHRWNLRSTHKLSTPVSTIENIDCSGLVRYEAYQATDGQLRIPDGSYTQRDWCEQRLKEVPYADAAKRDNVLRIAFLTPYENGVGEIGHVFWTFNSNTLESYGGHGVGSHKWTAYRNRVSKCFEVPSISGVATIPEAPTLEAPAIKIPVYDGPAFEVVVNNTGKNVGPGLIFEGKLYAQIDTVLHQIGKDIVGLDDLRGRAHQPRFYIAIGELE